METSSRILLGVSGGVAAYKACELARLLVKAGHQVQVVLTEAATRFVTPLQFQALTGRPARVGLFDEGHEAAMGHIELARWAEQVVVAPATADFLARLAAGIADDLLTTLCLATSAPLTVAPAMNHRMWEHPATRANRECLADRGVRFVGPALGDQACGDTGPGRMSEPEEILLALQAGGLFAGERVMVTAGPTREPLDPVRFFSNRSSGRMGYALAGAFAREGATVTLVSGPVTLAPPPGVERVMVETGVEMFEAVMDGIAGQDLFAACAAVADYRPAHPQGHKIKRSSDILSLELEPNPDILAAVAAREKRPWTLGFAAETENLESNARDKLVRKGVDMVAANRVGAGLGFETTDNALEVFWRDGRASLPRQSKQRLAGQLVGLVARVRQSSSG